MKILIPIDYSAASRQAMRYAFYLAEHMDAEINLLHVFDIPVMAADAYVFVPPPEEIEKIVENHIVHLKEFFANDPDMKPNQLKVNYHCDYGNPPERIIEFSKEKSADLIIMGIQGKCVQPSYFMGSTFIHVMNHSEIPVIALHSSTAFSDLKHILFTYDLKEFTDKSILQPIIQIANFFKAHIYVLNVSEEISDFPMLSEKLLKNDLHPDLLHADISFHVIQNKDTIEGINEFIKNQEVDLICFIPREHGILSKLFKESISRKAAFQINLPLMSIHN